MERSSHIGPSLFNSPHLLTRAVAQPRVLRLSVTERCDFHCRYCAPQSGFPKTPYDRLPSLDALAGAVHYLSIEWNVTKVKITGGEPLLRPGLPGLIRRIAALPNIDEISLSTNGSRFRAQARPLKEAGLGRVNVSIDTLDPQRFRNLCGGDLKDTLQGVGAAIDAGLTPVKINSVLRKDHWREDVPALVRYASDRGVEVRFIELMPIGPASGWAREQFVSARDVIAFLMTQGELLALPYQPGSPSRSTLFRQDSVEAKIGWITPESDSFCDTCNRLRLDNHGHLRRCLMDPETLDLVGMLANRGEIEVGEALAAYLRGKRPPELMQSDNSMIAIGG